MVLRTVGAVFACAIAGALTMVTLSTGFALLSQANTVAVAAGVLLLISAAAVAVGAGVMIAKKWADRVLLPVVLGLVLLTGACTIVEPGHVGIKVNYYGTERGVDSYPIVTGRVWYNPLTETVFQYPVFVQKAKWENVNYNSREGLPFAADLAFSFQLDPARVPTFYVKFREDNLTEFSDMFLRPVVQNAINNIAAKYTAEELYSDKKEALITEVEKVVNDEIGPYGLRVEQMGYRGGVRPPQQIIAAIEAKTTAIQNAARVENELRQSKAEAEKLVATAEGQARAQIAEAKGDAESRLQRALGEAKANEAITKSITPQLLEWRRMEVQVIEASRWNGQLPQITTGGTSGPGLHLWMNREGQK